MSTRRSRSGLRIESRRRFAAETSFILATIWQMSGRFFTNHKSRERKRGSWARSASLDGADREERNQADHRAHLERLHAAVRQAQRVVEEAVVLVPEPERVHRVGDVHEVLEELARHVLVARVVPAELHGDLQQVETVHRHPARPVGLLEKAAGRQLRAAVEDPDVVEAEKSALEDVVAGEVLAVHPPREVEQQLVEDLLQEDRVGASAVPLLDLVDSPRRPGVHRRVDVAELPLVGGDLPVRVHVPLAEQQLQLALGEVGVDERQGHAVKRQIPGGVPGVLPRVGHRQHVLVVEVRPVGVAAVQSRSAGGGGSVGSPRSHVGTS